MCSFWQWWLLDSWSKFPELKHLQLLQYRRVNPLWFISKKHPNRKWALLKMHTHTVRFLCRNKIKVVTDHWLSGGENKTARQTSAHASQLIFQRPSGGLLVVAQSAGSQRVSAKSWERGDWVNEWTCMYMVHKTSTQNLVCSQCQIHTVHTQVGSHKLKPPKDTHTNKVQTAPNHPPPRNSAAMHSN